MNTAATSQAPRKRVMLVQYAGDYREAWRRLQQSGTETYYGHRYVLEQLEGLQNECEVAMLCCLSPEPYHERLPNGLTVIGAAAHPRRKASKIIRIVEDWNPTHLVVLGPLTQLIRWGVNGRRRVLCQFADSFNINPLIRLLKYGRLAALLNNPGVEWISNHGINACRSLTDIGVDSDKILAWDWPYSRRPDQYPVRDEISAVPPVLLYVGTIQPKKGVGDAIAAIADLKRRGVPARLKLAGSGQIERFKALANKLGVATEVEFLGILPNAEVFDLMREVFAVVVPSRHDYPEGLPLTIYESLCARTPIVASDHPMFRGHLIDGQTAVVFPERRPSLLADKVAALIADRDLYLRLSKNALGAWQRMQNPVKWGDILRHWLADRPEDQKWLREHSGKGKISECPK